MKDERERERCKINEQSLSPGVRYHDIPEDTRQIHREGLVHDEEELKIAARNRAVEATFGHNM